ncbi:acyl-CoA carboxylase subunit epsilon [Rhodococcus tibetensis]|uniref:Acyl-CoA carboxylase subunit epsilon n=1 Tax=Rhodococcus tibetensis TaxID=2965064 RepID=A0ABT1QKQ6_9NOCA|nr:acyl-CoA carboxylase subunit epsilon [Rhodococcus sp. FXJ9.536]MCQ4122812.1 acyl-CoA carboxylase subunit epsilon [Rhodococcus sp. FXJ9.536]
MTAFTEERTENGSDKTATQSSVNGSAAEAALADADTTALPTDQPAATASEPFVRVIKGSPTDAELAALVTVLMAAASNGSGDPDSHLPPESWGAPTRMHRRVAPFSPYAFPNVSASRR